MIHELVTRARDPTTSDEEVEKSIYQYAATVLAQEGRQIHQAFVQQQAQRRAHEKAMHESMQQDMLKNPKYAEMVQRAQMAQGGPMGQGPPMVAAGGLGGPPMGGMSGPSMGAPTGPGDLPPADGFGFNDRGSSLMGSGFEMYPPPAGAHPGGMGQPMPRPMASASPPMMPPAPARPPSMPMQMGPGVMGPAGSMGGPAGSMGGPAGSMGGPAGSMGGHAGSMGGPAGSMGGPAGSMGHAPPGPSQGTMTDGSYMPSFGAVMGGGSMGSPPMGQSHPHGHPHGMGPPGQNMKNQPGFNMPPPGSKRARQQQQGASHYDAMMGGGRPGGPPGSMDGPPGSMGGGQTGDIPMPQFLSMQSDTQYEGTPVF